MTDHEARLRCLADDRGFTFGEEERAAVVWALKFIDSFVGERAETNKRIAEVCAENRRLKEDIRRAISSLSGI